MLLNTKEKEKRNNNLSKLYPSKKKSGNDLGFSLCVAYTINVLEIENHVTFNALEVFSRAFRKTPSVQKNG
jgi:hypothetical protein